MTFVVTAWEPHRQCISLSYRALAIDTRPSLRTAGDLVLIEHLLETDAI
jgi:hypothetical protein